MIQGAFSDAMSWLRCVVARPSDPDWLCCKVGEKEAAPLLLQSFRGMHHLVDCGAWDCRQLMLPLNVEQLSQLLLGWMDQKKRFERYIQRAKLCNPAFLKLHIYIENYIYIYIHVYLFIIDIIKLEQTMVDISNYFKSKRMELECHHCSKIAPLASAVFNTFRTCFRKNLAVPWQ